MSRRDPLTPEAGESSGAFLARLMAAAGTNPHRLSAEVGDLSATSLYGYLDDGVPSVSKAARLALYFEPEEGAALLHLWAEAAEAAEGERTRRTARVFEAASRSLDDGEVDRVRSRFLDDEPGSMSRVSGVGPSGVFEAREGVHTLTYSGPRLSPGEEEAVRYILRAIRLLRDG